MVGGIPKQKQFLTPTLVLLGAFLLSLWVYRPRRYYFFGDSWGCLWWLLTDWKTIFQPHNEYFVPLFKAFYLLEYKLFGGHHLPYMVVVFALHAAIAMVVFLLGRRLSLSSWCASAVVTIFTISSVHWQVTGWSFEQGFQLSALFALIAIYIFLPNPQGGKQTSWMIILSVIAYWFGPLSVALPFSLSLYYLLWLVDTSEHAPKGLILRTLGAVWLPSVIYLLSLRVVTTFSSVLATNRTHLKLQIIPSLIDFTLYGAVYGLVLPSLTFVNPQAVLSVPLILVLLALFMAICYQRLSAGTERIQFWFLICLLLTPLLAAAVIRLQMFGVQGAIASRYQYFPLVPLALLVGLCWVGFARTLQNRVAQAGFKVLGAALLGYYLLFHISLVRKPETNPAMDQGMRAREFLSWAKKATYPNSIPTDVSVLAPELPIPDFVTPGRQPFWQILQVLAGARHGVAPVGDYLSDWDATSNANLVRNGDFETPSVEKQWKIHGSGKWDQQRGEAALHGDFGVEIALGQGAAFSQDAITNCPSPLPRTIFTFSIQARADREGSLIGRVIFKDASNQILAGAESLPHPGGGQRHQMVISGLSPDGTCTVGVDVVNGGPSQLVAMLDEAILVAHPGTVDRNGRVTFQSLAVVLSGGPGSDARK